MTLKCIGYELTSNTGEELFSKVLDLAAREGHELICLEKVEDTLPEQIGNNTDVISKVEGVAKVYTLISIEFVVVGESLQNTEFYLRCIAVFLNRPDDFDCYSSFFAIVIGFYHLPKGALPQLTDGFV